MHRPGIEPGAPAWQASILPLNQKQTVPGKVMETCKYCDYPTQNKGGLIVHEMTHTGEKEFRCDWKGCNYRSIQKYCVKQHKFTRTKEKPFSCEHCNYTSA
ncbi:hypothetical protein LAZ67_3005581 [Cordylochernes scorpioides]|uniref:C2H2-type domain-containing protein n=1 Tax=Cordylochernes scorpioides TaxID=51811 RepID=A0ABY6KAF9_9ARAC|nr:hypothetical protein LAZ67_3005581 [Cordylochernes scorpioides]